MIAEADLVLAVGTEMADTDFWRERLPLSGELIRVDIDPRKFNDFYPSAVALRGDARQTLEALLARLPTGARRWQGELTGTPVVHLYGRFSVEPKISATSRNRHRAKTFGSG